jgi:AcrR family transcriptional regulator
MPSKHKIIAKVPRRRVHGSQKAILAPASGGRPKSKKEEIVKAAVKTFLENGYAATSMNQVADEAGVIKATIYSHFADKQQLFKAVIEEVVLKKAGTELAMLEEKLPLLSVEEFLDKLSARVLRLFQDDEYLRLISVVIGESRRFPEIADLYLRTVVLRAMELGQRYFKLHPELGIKDPLAAAHISCSSFWSLIMWQRLLGGEKYAPLEGKRVKKLLVEMLTR